MIPLLGRDVRQILSYLHIEITHVPLRKNYRRWMIIEFGIERTGRRLEAARLLLFISRALLVNRHVSSKVVILRQTTLGPLNGPLSIRLYLAIEVGVERPHIKILAWRPLLQIMIQRFA